MTLPREQAAREVELALQLTWDRDRSGSAAYCKGVRVITVGDESYFRSTPGRWVFSYLQCYVKGVGTRWVRCRLYEFYLAREAAENAAVRALAQDRCGQ